MAEAARIPPRLRRPDLDRVRQYCESRVPARIRDQYRLEVDVDGYAVSIMACRPPWTTNIGPEWTRLPVARMRYTASRGTWELFWRDRNLRWRHYNLAKPTACIQTLLAEIDRDPTCIFWG